MRLSIAESAADHKATAEYVSSPPSSLHAFIPLPQVLVSPTEFLNHPPVSLSIKCSTFIGAEAKEQLKKHSL